MYLEDVTNGRQFIETSRKIFWETHKPMLCLKSGRSPEGAKAVSSHTGSLAGSDSVYDALLRLSAMVCNHLEISELDVNPLIVHAEAQGCAVADSRVMLRRVNGHP